MHRPDRIAGLLVPVVVIGAVVIGAFTLSPTRARACGPDFPPGFLGTRAQTLARQPDGAFLHEAMHLVPTPSVRFPVVELEVSPWADDVRTQSHRAPDADRPGEPKGARAGCTARERALYDDAVRAFDDGDLQTAQARFAAVTSLPVDERRTLGLPALFMRGRIARLQANREAAAGFFTAVRDAVAAGTPDPLGLATSSLGAEARVRREQGDDVAAIRLYAQQAAHGSMGGAQSLLMTARSLVAATTNDPTRLQRALQDPLARRLLAMWLWTRGFPTWDDDTDDDTDADSDDDVARDSSAHAQQGESDTQKLLAMFAARDDVADSGMLAAAAFRAGRFDLAARFASHDDSGLSLWVRARLAIRRGLHTPQEYQAVDALLARAGEAWPVDERWHNEDAVDATRPRGRIATERSILALAQGRHSEALAFAVDSGVWQDIAYLGERVLTVDELLAFVRARWPDRAVESSSNKPPMPRDDGDAGPAHARVGADGGEGNDDGDTNDGHSDDDAELRDEMAQDAWRTEHWYTRPPSSGLRLVLARRLMRAGRVDEAIVYFDDDALRAKANGFAEVWAQTQRGDDDARALALFRASRILRRDGMDVWGMELGRDWSIYDGLYAPDGFDDVDATQALAKPDAAWVAPDERARVAASASSPDVRFHYRARASALAEQAASLVPQRSQAFAALLCTAARDVMFSDDARVAALWRRYVHEGPAVPFASTFGVACPEPDFTRIHDARVQRVMDRMRGPPMRLRYKVAGALVAAMGAIAVVVAVRRRRRALRTHAATAGSSP